MLQQSEQIGDECHNWRIIGDCHCVVLKKVGPDPTRATGDGGRIGAVLFGDLERLRSYFNCAELSKLKLVHFRV